MGKKKKEKKLRKAQRLADTLDDDAQSTIESLCSVGGGTGTRGLRKRHVLERKALKVKVEQLKRMRFKLNKKDHAQKKEKKEISKKIKELHTQLVEQQQKETDEFSSNKETQGSGSDNDDDSVGQWDGSDDDNISYADDASVLDDLED